MSTGTSVRRTSEATVAFVDLAGFAALTEVHGDDRAVELVEEFEGFAAAALGPRDRLVKMLGDAAMFAFADPGAALAALRRVIGTCLNAPGFPLPRAGIHHGPVVERAGDLFGRTVNLAARVADQARGGEVVVTREVAKAASDAGLEVTYVGLYRLRNLSGSVALFEVTLCALPAASSVDPVCRMRVDQRDAPNRLRHGDAVYWFCSPSCADTFTSDPDGFVAALAV